MAATQEAAALTEQHRQAQLKVRAQALRDYTRLWPIWRSDSPESFGSLVTATLPLARVYHRISAAAAASYYDAFRAAEGVTGEATPRLSQLVPDAMVTASMYVTGQVMTRNALLAGQTVEQARETALVRTSGALTRQILAGGRDTLIGSVQADPQALGWARVTDGNPCAFCAMLASRGPVYKTAESGGFEAHDHCGCTVEPFYRGADWPPGARDYRDLYNKAIAAAQAAGELDRGTSNDLLNALRRAYSGRQ